MDSGATGDRKGPLESASWLARQRLPGAGSKQSSQRFLRFRLDDPGEPTWSNGTMKPLRIRLQEARSRLGLPWEALERDYLLQLPPYKLVIENLQERIAELLIE